MRACMNDDVQYEVLLIVLIEDFVGWKGTWVLTKFLMSGGDNYTTT